MRKDSNTISDESSRTDLSTSLRDRTCAGISLAVGLCRICAFEHYLRGWRHMNKYEELYRQDEYYWGFKPSPTCLKVLTAMPPTRRLKLLDIGCGEGRNAVFFARNGYDVTAFDLAQSGVDKTKRLAERVGVDLKVFRADINEYRLTETFDILFSTGVLHYVPQELREELFDNYKAFTSDNGIHMFSVFVKKPFIAPAPDGEATSKTWISGELLTHYHDWLVEHCTEEIFDCMSGGVAHKHCTDRVLARKVTSLV